jgi:hypothetical protein
MPEMIHRDGWATISLNLGRTGQRHHPNYTTFSTILLMSAAVKDRKVCMVTFSRELNDNIAAVAVSCLVTNG